MIAIFVGLLVMVTEDQPISTTGFLPFSISTIDLTEITPASPVDYLGVFESFDGIEGDAISSIGIPCSGAVRRSTCTSNLEVVRANAAAVTYQPCGMCRGVTFFGTRGDEVFVVEDLRQFVGAIDTPTEAALAVQVGSWVRSSHDGFEVIGSRLTAECDPIVEVTTLWHVGHDGTVTELDRQEHVENGACI